MKAPDPTEKTGDAGSDRALGPDRQMPADKRIGIVAGSGQFPILFTEAAKAKGYAVYAAAYVGEADSRLADLAADIKWVHLGQVRKLIQFFKANRISQAVFAGGIQKTRMFSDVKPDVKAISLIIKVKTTHDDNILKLFADVLEKEGIRIISATVLLPGLLAPDGCWTRRKPNRAEAADIDLGWKLAKEIGRLDIGQCIVIGGGSVLAVEAIDGTDATIQRGAALGRGNASVVKICKPNQDLRFDMPAVGTQTVETMVRSGATALAVEAGKTLVFNRDEMIDLADRKNVAIVARH